VNLLSKSGLAKEAESLLPGIDNEVIDKESFIFDIHWDDLGYYFLVFSI